MNLRVADRLADSFATHSVTLFRFDASLRRTLRRLLTERVERELVTALAQADPTAPARVAFKARRLAALLDQARTVTRAGYRAVATEHERALRGLAEVESEFVATTVNRTVGTRVMTVAVPDKVLNAIPRSVLIDGAPSRDWWAGQADRTRRAFERVVRSGMTQGQSVSDMVRRVRGTPAQRYADGALQANWREAEALVRSSVMATANAVHAETFKQNADVVRGVQVLVVFDARTSETCLALGSANAAWDHEGNPLPESAWREPQPPGPPFHWNCRTVLVPVLGALEDIAAETGIAKARRLEGLAPEMQEALDGGLAASLTVETWLRDKPESFVTGLLGKTRAKLWRDGKLALSQLVDQSGRPLNLDQLRERVRGVTAAAIEEARAA